jgi:membrane fusion protein, heavy metal efflux system
MKRQTFRTALLLTGAAVLCFAFYIGRTDLSHSQPEAAQALSPQAAKADVVEVSPQARKNLGLIVTPLALQTYWKTIQLPGTVIDRPGRTDRGVASPIAGVVAAVHAFPGDIVKPGAVLFSIKPSSEYLQNSQSELFKAARDLELLLAQKERLDPLADSGAVARSRVIEIEQEMSRKTATLEALQQDLKVRGLSKRQIEGAKQGKFATDVSVFAPTGRIGPTSATDPAPATLEMESGPFSGKVYEVQELSVSLGAQIEAGAVLCFLADNETLYVEGHAYKQEAPNLEQAVQENWPIRIEFSETKDESWEELDANYHIERIANAIDPESRTFAFYVPLVNQSRRYTKDDKEFVVWRFRPGERVRLHVPVEEMKEVLVLPAAGVAREGPEAFVFRQNGDLFNRLPVHVLHEDRLNIIVANDGSVRPGFYVAQNGAASLNRILKAQSASGMPAGVHVHADGTVHEAH